MQPRWSGDGRELIYVAPDASLMAADVRFEPSFGSGAPRTLFHPQAGLAGSNTKFRWSLTRDGKRFLLVSPATGASSTPATVVLNWQAALKKK